MLLKIIDAIFQCLDVDNNWRVEFGDVNATILIQRILLNCFIVDRMIRFFIKGRFKTRKLFSTYSNYEKDHRQ